MSEFIVDKRGEYPDLAIGKLIAKRGHTISAFGDLFVDLILGLEFELSGTKARHNGSVLESLAISLGTVADGTVLSKQRGIVFFAFSNNETPGFCRLARNDKTK